MLSLVISYHQLTSKCYQGNQCNFVGQKNRRFSEMTFISHFRSSSLSYILHWLPAEIVPTPFILCYSSISVSYVYDFSVIYTHNPDILLNSYYYADTEVSLNTHLIAIIYTYYYIYVRCLLFLISIKQHSYI